MKDLLDDILKNYRNSKVLVTGYYKIVSDESDLVKLQWVIGAFAEIIDLILSNGDVPDLVDRSKLFKVNAHQFIQLAIKESNANDQNKIEGKDRVYFVDPEFDDDNAVAAPNSFLWEVSQFLEPVDTENVGGVAEKREVECEDAKNRISSLFQCKRASLGHPNVDGARRYYEKMKDRWDTVI